MIKQQVKPITDDLKTRVEEYISDSKALANDKTVAVRKDISDVRKDIVDIKESLTKRMETDTLQTQVIDDLNKRILENASEISKLKISLFKLKEQVIQAVNMTKDNIIDVQNMFAKLTSELKVDFEAKYTVLVSLARTARGISTDNPNITLGTYIP